MTTMKTFALAAVAALSLGVGTAMAQESADGAFLLNQQTTAPAQQAAPAMAQPQAGSSDVEQNRAPLYQQQYLLGSDGGNG